MTAFARNGTERNGTGRQPRAAGVAPAGGYGRHGPKVGDTGGVRTDPALVEAIETCHDEWDPTRSPDTAGFDALLERWPDDPVALVAVGDAYDECGGTDKAVSYYR